MRWLIVTKGWPKVFVGVILLSASRRSIRFRRSINSRLSAFSANMSVPSKWEERLTWNTQNNKWKTITLNGSNKQYDVVVTWFLGFVCVVFVYTVKTVSEAQKSALRYYARNCHVPASCHPGSWRYTSWPPWTWCPSPFHALKGSGK